MAGAEPWVGGSLLASTLAAYAPTMKRTIVEITSPHSGDIGEAGGSYTALETGRLNIYMQSNKYKLFTEVAPGPRETIGNV